MDKNEIANIFEEIALLLELKGENPFRIRAYRNAARAVLSLDEDLKTVALEKRLTSLEGIGDDLADKITTLVKTGRLPFYEKLKKSIPSGLVEMMRVHGLGGKKIKTLYEKLKIKSIDQLKEACKKGKTFEIARIWEKNGEKHSRIPGTSRDLPETASLVGSDGNGKSDIRRTSSVERGRSS